MYSPDGTVVMQTKKADVDIRCVIREHLMFVDFILIEGGRTDRSFKKIEVLRKGVSEKPSCTPEELIAIVSDFEMGTDIPVFHPDDIEKIADFMENYPMEKEPQLRLDIDEVAIPMNPFVQKIFTNTLMGMIRSLEGIPEDPGCITLSLSRKGKKHEKI